jgi:hypothetical protein
MVSTLGVGLVEVVCTRWAVPQDWESIENNFGRTRRKW